MDFLNLVRKDIFLWSASLNQSSPEDARHAVLETFQTTSDNTSTAASYRGSGFRLGAWKAWNVKPGRGWKLASPNGDQIHQQICPENDGRNDNFRSVMAMLDKCQNDNDLQSLSEVSAIDRPRRVEICSRRFSNRSQCKASQSRFPNIKVWVESMGKLLVTSIFPLSLASFPFAPHKTWQA